MLSTKYRPDPEVLPDWALPDERLLRVVERPDGFHWIAIDGRQQFGPFASLDEALADMADSDDEAIESGDEAIGAGHELGILDWIDPDTGEPAEDTRVRLEEH